METREIRHAAVMSGNEILTVEVIEFEGKLWLATLWLQNKAAGLQRPIRLISLSDLPHYAGALGHDFLVSVPVPKAVLDGEATPEEERPFLIRTNPEIVFSIQGGRNAQ